MAIVIVLFLVAFGLLVALGSEEDSAFEEFCNLECTSRRQKNKLCC